MNESSVEKIHLDILIYNDAMSMDMQGINHNAADRASMYETWKEDIQAPDFEARARAARERCDRYIYNERIGKYSEEMTERFLSTFDRSSLS